MSQREPLIGIVTYRPGRELEECIRTVRENTVGRIVVWDNSEPEYWTGEWEGKFPGVVFHRDGENIGFGRAINRIVERSSEPFILIMNSDVEILPGTIERIKERLETDPRIAVVAPVLYDSDRTVQTNWSREFPSFLRMLANKLIVLEKLRLLLWYRSPLRRFNRPPSAAREVAWVGGACFAVRREVFEKVGGFDRDFFLYLEECDFMKRVSEVGGKVVIDPLAKVRHKWAVSADRNRKEVTVHGKLSELIYAFKHFPRSQFKIIRTAAGWESLLKKVWFRISAKTEHLESYRLYDRIRKGEEVAGISDKYPDEILSAIRG